jgi:hypothetical protein
VALVLVLVLGCGVDGRADKKRVVRFTGHGPPLQPSLGGGRHDTPSVSRRLPVRTLPRSLRLQCGALASQTRWGGLLAMWGQLSAPPSTPWMHCTLVCPPPHAQHPAPSRLVEV